MDEQGRAYATGKRKTSVARVWIWEGPGSIQINGRSLDMCFPQLNRRAEILSPFQVLFQRWSFRSTICSATLQLTKGLRQLRFPFRTPFCCTHP